MSIIAGNDAGSPFLYLTGHDLINQYVFYPPVLEHDNLTTFVHYAYVVGKKLVTTT